MNDFFGRREELEKLNRLKSKRTASLVCIYGRRRIGKSTLIQRFSAGYGQSFFIQGLAPVKSMTNQDQLNHFRLQYNSFFHQNQESISDWTTALTLLASATKRGKWVISLDEISWLGGFDPAFSSKLKDVWDMHFKKNSNLILFICGSVSSWIDENILQDINFEGRISLEMNLHELSLLELNEFWKPFKGHISAFEKMKILSVTGGVPKYLEEVMTTETAEQNLLQLCFSKEGFLFNEFEKIFTDVFRRRSSSFEKIVRTCMDRKQSAADIAKKLNITQDSELSQKLKHLEYAGFLSRDYVYRPSDGKELKMSYYRVRDNYLRFYIKVIEKEKSKIKSKSKTYSSLNSIKGFEAIMGYQFENLILANRHLILPILKVSSEQVQSSSPYYQPANTKQKACQIDLLIHTDLDVFFACEFKCKKEIDRSVVSVMKEKVKKLKLPKRASLRPVLIYEGEMLSPHREQINEYFFKVISLSELLQSV